LEAKAFLNLDGQELEIIIQELTKGIIRAKKMNNYYRSDQLEILVNRFKIIKQTFHHEWAEKILKRYNQTIENGKNPLVLQNQ
jgi:hypothetical protein